MKNSSETEAFLTVEKLPYEPVSLFKVWCHMHPVKQVLNDFINIFRAMVYLHLTPLLMNFALNKGVKFL